MKSIIPTLSLLLLCMTHLFAQTSSNENQMQTVATYEDSSMVLTWELNREVNTSYFVIERANSDSAYKTIATADAKGYSVFLSSYSFEDVAFPDEASSYRVILVTMDGQRITSDEVFMDPSGVMAAAPAQ